MAAVAGHSPSPTLATSDWGCDMSTAAKKHSFYSPRANAVGWVVVGLLAWLIVYLCYGAPAYAPLLVYTRLPRLHAGMPEPDVWRTLGVRPYQGIGDGPGDDYRVGYRLPFGYSLAMRWDRTSQPSRLKRATLVAPWG